MSIVSENPRFSSASNWKAKAVLWLVLCLVLSSISVLCLLPPVSRDAVIHHLALPKIYLETGWLHELPCMIFSYYPMNIDILYGVALYAGSEILAKFIHFSFGGLTAVLIYLFLRKRLGQLYGLVGAVLFYSIPIIIRLSAEVYVDLGLIFFSTGALFSLCKWKDRNFKRRHLILAGFLCGLAMGTKYNGFICFVLLLMSIPFLSYKPPFKTGFRSLVLSLFLFSLVSLSTYSPWGIRNWVWTGNPVYPLYDNLIGNPYANPCINAYDPGSETTTRLSALDYRAFIYGEGWLSRLMLPVKIFFLGKDNDPSLFDGKLSPLLFCLPLLFIFLEFVNKRSIPREDIVLFLFSWFYILIALITQVARARYLGPAIPPLVVLSVKGLYNLSLFRKKDPEVLWKGLLGSSGIISAIMIFQFITTAAYIHEQYQRYEPLSYLGEKVSKKGYVKKFRPENYCFDVVNTRLPEESKLLFVFMGKRGYYCQRNYVPDRGNNLKLLYALGMASHSKHEIVAQKFKKSGITHFMMNNALTLGQLKSDLSKSQQDEFQNFISKKIVKICDSHGFSLYEFK